MLFRPDVPLWTIALVLPLDLLFAWVFASIARLLLRGRAKIGTATSIVVAVLATSLGLLVTGWIRPDAAVFSPLSILICLGFSVAAIAAYGAVAAYVQRPVRASVPELLAQGESDRLEFKSTARVNLHTGAKDERMEQVIAKAVCGFLNADGGVLLIGVDDTGTVLGLERDFATLKAPDADRFELWLRDLLTSTLGANAASLVAVDFASLPAGDDEGLVCRVDCSASPRPVYLRAKGAAPELYVRTGNSTRQLRVDDAADYVMHRWPLSMGNNFAAQVKAAVRFSGELPPGR